MRDLLNSKMNGSPKKTKQHFPFQSRQISSINLRKLMGVPAIVIIFKAPVIEHDEKQYNLLFYLFISFRNNNVTANLSRPSSDQLFLVCSSACPPASRVTLSISYKFSSKKTPNISLLNIFSLFSFSVKCDITSSSHQQKQI